MASATQSQLERAIAAFRLRLLRHEAAASQALSIAYADVLATLDGQIIAVSELIADARASGVTPSPSWLFQQERYRELRRQTIAAMEHYAAQTQQVATASQQAVVRASIQQAGQLLAPISGGSGGALAQMVSGWAQLPEQSIINMVGALQQGTPLANSLTRYGPDAVARVTETLVRGMSLGWGADETARQLRSQINITRASSESLVRTSTMHASRSAMIAAYRESGVTVGWRWTASLSERTCSSCLSKHNKVYPLSTPMVSHRSCFPAGTLCSGPEVVGSSTRWYEGDLVDIRFASGNFISVTPNHPILTPHGWVASGLLNEGGSVIRSSLSERELATIYPHYQHGPALIEQVAESFCGPSAMVAVTVPSTPEDFHGDGSGSQVSVIRSNRLLGSRFDPTIYQPALQDEFGGRGARLSQFPRSSRLAALIECWRSAANSVVCGCRECLSFFCAELGHAHVHAIGTAAWGFSDCQQAASNHIPTDSVHGCEGLFRGSRSVSLCHLIDRDVGIRKEIFGPLLSSNRSAFLQRSEQSALFENARQPALLGMEPSGGLLGAFAGNVSIDRVLDVSVRRFSGHVYNLETTDGWYIANNIVVHNCRCTCTPVLNNESDDNDYESGDAWLKRQPVDVQGRVLGKQGAAAYRAGEVELDDFSRLVDDPVYGSVSVDGGIGWARSQAKRRGYSASGGGGGSSRGGRRPGSPEPDDDHETHPLNSKVRKGQDGIWGSDDLPVMEWEAAGARVVLTSDLQEALDLNSPILRWSKEKRESVLREHASDPRDVQTLRDVSGLLRLPIKAGRDPRAGREEWLVYSQVDERMYRVVIGRDGSGSVNIVTLYGSSKPQRIRQWTREMERMSD